MGETKTMKSLIDKFLSLRCAGDVLESVQPLTSDVTRRIGESMALIEAIRPLILKHKGEYKLIELCSGTPLTSVIAAHLLPIEHATAYVWRPKYLPGLLDRVHHFKCHVSLAATLGDSVLPEKTIVIAPSVNPENAMFLVDLCHRNNAPMAMIPSRGKIRLSRAGNELVKINGSRYFAWLHDLADYCDGDVRVPPGLVNNDDMNCGLITRGL